MNEIHRTFFQMRRLAERDISLGEERWGDYGAETREYESSFEHILSRRLYVTSFIELIEQRSKELQKPLRVLDLMGPSASFLEKISLCLGFGFGLNVTLIKDEGSEPEDSFSRSRVETVYGDIFVGATWEKIRKKAGKEPFDLIVCRPSGAFTTTQAAFDMLLGLQVLPRTYGLLSSRGGILLSQTPSVRHSGISWWIEELKGRGINIEVFPGQGTMVHSLLLIRDELSPERFPRARELMAA